MTSQESQPNKKVLTSLPVRSRINADKELWDEMTILKQDARTSGNKRKVFGRIKKNFEKTSNPIKNRCYTTIRTKF